jgi:hypothetical protein
MWRGNCSLCSLDLRGSIYLYSENECEWDMPARLGVFYPFLYLNSYAVSHSGGPDIIST